MRFLGAGGMGAVYEAEDTRLDRRIALKIIPISHLGRTERFHREAKMASAVNHPNFVTIYDIGEENNVNFIAMEYVEGKTLAVRMAEGPITKAARYSSR